jgi:hypothetical protein
LSRADRGNSSDVETVVYRLPTRLEALAAAHMLRSRGHAAGIQATAFADHGSTLIVRTSRDGLSYVRALIESMFPSAVRCPDLNSRTEEQTG